MPYSRRALLAVGGSVVVAGGAFGAWRMARRAEVLAAAPVTPAAAAPGVAAPAVTPPAGDPRFAERSIGLAGAPVTVTEWFSLTCSHCAAFHRDSMPRIKVELIETGKLRMVFRDFPLDQVALTAAVVARSLPVARYEPFVSALLASQDRWAFNRQANPVEELAKMAALAGLGREAFNAAIADTELRAAILKGQEEADKMFKVDSTPSFIFNGPAAQNRRESGGRSPDDFVRLVAAATG